MDGILLLDKYKGKMCEQTHPCENYFHCQTDCNDEGRCQIKSSNIQLLCNNVLNEGIRVKGGKTIPGLKLSEYASNTLIKVIEDCSVLGFNDTQLVKKYLDYELMQLNKILVF